MTTLLVETENETAQLTMRTGHAELTRLLPSQLFTPCAIDLAESAAREDLAELADRVRHILVEQADARAAVA